MKNPDAAAFVTDVMARLGAANPTELSKKLGPPWTDRDQQRKLYKWHRGEQGPNLGSTLALLRAAGMLREDAGVVSAVPPVGRGERDRLAELEAAVEAQGAATTRALRSLAKEVRALARQPAPAAQPATRKRATQ